MPPWNILLLHVARLTYFFLFLYFWDCSLITVFPLSSFQALPYIPPCSPSNSWYLFSLIVIYIYIIYTYTHILLYTHMLYIHMYIYIFVYTCLFLNTIYWVILWKAGTSIEQENILDRSLLFKSGNHEKLKIKLVCTALWKNMYNKWLKEASANIRK